jgi:hypothetical protein
MGRQDVRQALVAMEQDENVRERLAAGDFGAVEGLDLTDEEQTLVQDAANDMPEVAGFGADLYLQEITRRKSGKGGIQTLDFGEAYMKWQNAVEYTFEY